MNHGEYRTKVETLLLVDVYQVYKSILHYKLRIGLQHYWKPQNGTSTLSRTWFSPTASTVYRAFTRRASPYDPSSVSLQGQFTNWSKHLTTLLKPLVGKSPHYIRSSQHFVEIINYICTLYRTNPRTGYVTSMTRSSFGHVGIKPYLFS